MGGKVYDRRPLPLDRDPLKQLSTELGKRKSTAELLAEQRKRIQQDNPVLKLIQLIAGTETGTPTIAQVVAGWEHLHEQQMAKIYEATGINLTSFEAFIASLDDGAGIDLPGLANSLADVIAAFDGIEWGTQGALLRLLGNLLKLPTGGGTPTIAQLLAKAAELFFGPIRSHRISQVSVGAITSDRPNLLASWDIAESTGGDWTFDADGFGPRGSVSAVADGDSIVLVSPFVVPVSPGQQLHLSWPVRWTGLAGAGTLVRLELITGTGTGGSGGGAVLPVSLPFVVGSGAGSGGGGAGAVTLDDSEGTGTSGWVELAGDWTVPADVTGVRARLRISTAATAGTVWADGLPVLRVTGDIEQTWVRGLVPDLSGLFDWLQELVNRLLLAMGLPPSGGLLTRINTLGDEISDWLDRTEEAAAALLDKLGLDDWHDWLTATWDDFLDALQTNPVSVLGMIPQALVSGLELAISTVNGLIQGVIDRIHNAFANLGEMLDEDNPLSKVVDAILGIFDTARAGSAKAVALEARIRALESSANTITLTFNGAATSSLPSSDYDIRRIGGGSGDIGTDGKGSAIWKPAGNGSRIVLARYKLSSLTVDNGHIQWILATNPQPYVWDDAYTYLLFRMNTANNTMMRLRSGYDSLQLQAVVSDVVTDIGSPADVDPKAGNDFDIWFGEAVGANPRHFVVSQKGEVIIDTVDTGAVSSVGSSYRHVGIGMETGNYLLVGQNRPAGLSVVTASEVL